MANPARGEVSFEAGGTTYKLVMDYNALCEMEDAFGVNADQIGEAVGKSAKNLRTVFRIGLMRHHADTTDERAGDIISELGPESAGDLVTEAFTRAFPQEVKKGKRPLGSSAKAS